jgi:NAD(P)-dependent dehydrogenase (short-subunit alcohol dehydrogenase family)
MTASTKKVVLVTGGNSGLGFHACLHIAKQANHHLILTGRDAQRVHDAAEKVRAVAAASTIVEEGVLDLGNLTTIQAYCKQLTSRSDVPEISTLLCNGALQLPRKETTHDGLEITFGVNHLGHFLLATLLRERTRRIVIISSEVHDPAERAPVPHPNVSDLEKLAFGYEPFNGGEAYSTSKLCNLLFMFEWIRRFPTSAEVIAFAPGFTPDTALAREMALDVDAAIAICKAHGVYVGTSEVTGAFMGRLATENWSENGWASGQYIRVHEVYEPSAQAKDPKLAAALWEKSAELIERLTSAK